jgi:hypothetical protein
MRRRRSASGSLSPEATLNRFVTGIDQALRQLPLPVLPDRLGPLEYREAGGEGTNTLPSRLPAEKRTRTKPQSFNRRGDPENGLGGEKSFINNETQLVSPLSVAIIDGFFAVGFALPGKKQRPDAVERTLAP